MIKNYKHIILILFLSIFTYNCLYAEKDSSSDYLDNYIKNNNININTENLFPSLATINDYKNILSNLNSDLARSFLCNSLITVINNFSNDSSNTEELKVIIDCATYIDNPNEKVISSLSETIFKLRSQNK